MFRAILKIYLQITLQNLIIFCNCLKQVLQFVENLLSCGNTLLTKKEQSKCIIFFRIDFSCLILIEYNI